MYTFTVPYLAMALILSSPNPPKRGAQLDNKKKGKACMSGPCAQGNHAQCFKVNCTCKCGHR